MTPSNRSISSERKATYYVGMAVAAVGLVLVLTTFVSFVDSAGNLAKNPQSRPASVIVPALIGGVLLVIGQFVMRLGARGLAGSGVILDPSRARKDIEPWSRMGGGIVRDALAEIDVAGKVGNPSQPPKAQVKVRCKQCQALNDETSKFCGQCAAPT